MKVAKVMTTNVKSCNADTNLAAVTQLMWENDCGVVPVVNERAEVVGILTDRDICIALGTRNQAASTVRMPGNTRAAVMDVIARTVSTCS